MPTEGGARAGGGDLGRARRVPERADPGAGRFRDRGGRPEHVRRGGRAVRRGRDRSGTARRRAIACDRRSVSRRRRRRRRRKRRSRLRVRDRRRRRHRRGSERRKEDLRVDVALGIRGESNTELHVWHRVLGNAARPDDRDRLALGNDGAPRDQRRAEVQEGHGVALAGLDRDRQTVRRDPADKRHSAAGGSQDGIAERTLDVDAAMLAGRERVVLGEEKAAQDGAVDGPRPRARGGGEDE